MHDVLRIIDANANRSREALRVMEEAARFLLDDASLCEDLKNLRHDLATALLRFHALPLHRDVVGDVGTTIATDNEMSRAGVADVVIAAGKRLSESLRAMEEYGKVIDPAFAVSIEAIRYRGYDLEKRLTLRLVCSQTRQWRLCVLITESLCNRSWQKVARASIEAGAECLQLREKNIDDRDLLQRARELVQIADHRASVVINDRADIALLAGADGVHLGQGDLSPQRVREIAGTRLIIGVSTSSLRQAEHALAEGADYCGVGPMFPSTTKQKKTIVGPDSLREYLRWDRLPHLAIGGITVENINQLVEAGCRGIAVSAAVCQADDPAAVVSALLDAI